MESDDDIAKVRTMIEEHRERDFVLNSAKYQRAEELFHGVLSNMAME